MADRWYIADDDGIRTPVAGFDDDGYPLALDADQGRLRRYDGVAQDLDREGPVIPAGPGWYVLYAAIENGELLTNRRPIVAWEASDWGGAFVVNDTFFDEQEAISRAGRGLDTGYHAVAIFHGVYQPEYEAMDVRGYVEHREKIRRIDDQRWAERQVPEGEQ
jgi:hypothetical protein